MTSAKKHIKQYMKKEICLNNKLQMLVLSVFDDEKKTM